METANNHNNDRFSKPCRNGCGKRIRWDKAQNAFIEIDTNYRHRCPTPFDPQIQLYPADLFILVGFDSKGQPIWERNPRWHDSDGFYIGESS
jgi:hypothetical protein